MQFSDRMNLGEKLDAWVEENQVAKTGHGYLSTLLALRYLSDNGVIWTHEYCCAMGQYRCIVIKTRIGFMGWLQGKHRVLLEDGSVEWVRTKQLMPLKYD